MNYDHPFFVRGKTTPKGTVTGKNGKWGLITPWGLDILSRYQWWFIALAGLFLISLQAVEHLIYETILSHSWLIFWGEVVYIGLLLGLIGFLISRLLITLSEKSRVINILQMKHQFAQRLSASQDIPEVSQTLVQQIALIIPFVKIELYLYDKDKDWFIRVHAQGENVEISHSEELNESISSHACRECLLQKGSTLHTFEDCRREDHLLQFKDQDGFCLPLMDGFRVVGLLLLYTPAGEKPDHRQMELLENLSEEMSYTFERLIEKKIREEANLAERVRTMQLDIARDLHDTVGQNIGFLRMKLDHLSEKNEGEQTELVMEIRSMAKVANESYDLVRGTLAVLQTESSSDLLYLFSRYSEQVAERSAFKIDFSTQGLPLPLSSERLRHVFYIFREALSNIEKHANASQVHVSLSWGKDDLLLIIRDDGKGYDTSRTQRVDIHYGIKFMRERTALLKGRFNIHSAVVGGTQISVDIPCVD
jgi:signal transduction histidine kinase